MRSIKATSTSFEEPVITIDSKYYLVSNTKVGFSGSQSFQGVPKNFAPSNYILLNVG